MTPEEIKRLRDIETELTTGMLETPPSRCHQKIHNARTALLLWLEECDEKK